MGSMCHLCHRTQNSTLQSPDLKEVDNILPHLQPQHFYCEGTRKIQQRYARLRYLYQWGEEVPESGGEREVVMVENGIGCCFYGQMKGGLREGQGKQKLCDFTVYQGYWKDDKAHGKGRIIYPEGQFYEGNWLRGKREGKGKLIHPDGCTYIGEWMDDHPHGKGIEHHPGETRYVGQYQRGVKQGHGRLEWIQNELSQFYEGEFVENVMEGEGMLCVIGESVYEGEWKGNMKNGRGKLTFDDGRSYEGQFVDDLFEGEGTFKWPDGRQLQSQWKEGIPSTTEATVDPRAYRKEEESQYFMQNDINDNIETIPTYPHIEIA